MSDTGDSRRGELVIRLLGEPSLEQAGSPVGDRLRYRRSLELLAFLAVERQRWHPRAGLAQMLWPESELGAARTSLRQVVSDLRAFFAALDLADAFQASRSALMFVPGPDITLDLAEFEAGCAATEDACDWVGRLYRGPLLDLADGLPDEGPFAEWLMLQRERYRLQATGLLAARTDRLEAEGDLQGAEACARRLAEFVPVDEAAYRRLIRLLDARGERARALRQYEILRRRLAAEMDGEPDAETRLLVAGIEGGSTATPPPESTREVRERRLVTCLCCELLPAAAPGPEIDDETLAEALESTRHRVARRIRQHDGRVEARPGQPVFGYFGFPVACEWAARLAARAAQAIIDACDRPVRARVAIHSGSLLVDLGQGLPDVLGQAADRAQRLCLLGEPDDVILDETTWHGVRSAFGGEPMGGRRLPASDEVVDVWRLGPPQAAEAWLSAPCRALVGRSRELRQLRQAWREAAEGAFRCVFVEGEAGIGKTRLVAEQVDAVTREGGRVRGVRCLPEQQDSPLAPVRHLFEELAGIGPQDDGPARRRKLGGWIDRHWPAGDLEGRQLLVRLVAARSGDEVAPSTEGDNPLFTMLIARVLELVRQAPLLLVLEDAHWIDLTTRELLRRLVDRFACTAQPLMLVVTQRSGYPPPPLPEDARTLVLGPLDAFSADRLLASVDHHRRLSAERRGELARRCAGVPLFLEELVRRHERDASTEVLPASLLSLFQAEIDRLGGDRRVLLTASVLGQDFTGERLAAMFAGQPQAPALARLCRQRFLQRRQSVFRFRHDLIREAAYGMLTLRRRRELHARLAEHLLHYDRSREEEPEIIARHLEAAGDVGYAIRWWHHAGRLALRDQAVLDANRHFARALELAERQPPEPTQRLALVLDASEGIIRVEGYGSLRARGLLQQALELAEREGDPAAEFRALTGLWFSDSCYDEQDHGVSTARRLLGVADDERQRLTARFALGNSLFWIGAFAEATDHLHAAAEMGDRLEGDAPLIVDRPSLMARAANCWTLWFLDRVDQAEAVFAAGYRRAQALQEHYSTCYLLTFGANLYRCMGDAERVAALSETILELARRHRFALWEGVGSLTRAWAAVNRGEPVDLATIHRQFAVLQEAYPGGLVTFRAIIAETRLALGHFAEALEQIDAALEEMQRTREIYFEPELHRLRAICLAHLPAAEAPLVEYHLERAVETAGRLASPPLQRRAEATRQRWQADGLLGLRG